MKRKKSFILGAIFLALLIFSLSFVFVGGDAGDDCYNFGDCLSVCESDTTISRYRCAYPHRDPGVCVLRATRDCLGDRVCVVGAGPRGGDMCVDPGTTGGYEAVCGARNSPNANDELDMIYCCPVNSATVEGSPIAYRNPGANSRINCPVDHVVCGARNSNANNHRLEEVFCCPVTGGTVDPSSASGPYDATGTSDPGWNVYCPDGQAVCGVQAPNEDDKIDQIYCCTIDGGTVGNRSGSYDSATPGRSVMCPGEETVLPSNGYDCSSPNCLSDPDCVKCCKCDADVGSGYSNLTNPNCNIIRKDCNEIYDVHESVCDCGDAYSPCWMRDSGTCEQTSECSWCHQPDSNSFPYTFPSTPISENPTGDSVCVDTTWDPYNCGRCGFNEDGTNIVFSNGQGFCPAASPFCVGGSCEPKSNVAEGDFYVSEEVMKAGHFNPVYHYDVHSDGSGAYYSSWHDIGGGSGSTIPNYLLDDINNDETICAAATGGTSLGTDYDFVDGLGCCGDRKCREISGTVCHTRAICDGNIWHDASNPDQSGEVFTNPTCAPETMLYPVANINGELVRCVDVEREVFYINTHQIGTAICNPENEGKVIDPGIGGGMQYVCGSGEYSVGGFRSLSDNTCAGHGQLVRELSRTDVPVHYVCDVSAGIGDNSVFAFASIVDTSGVNTIGLEEGRGAMGYENCPAGITSTWVSSDPPDSVTTPAILPCPGKIEVGGIDFSNNFPYEKDGNNRIRTWGFSLGGPYHGRTLQICRQPISGDDIDTPWVQKLNTLKYYLSNGSIMGKVENNSYICFTDETMTPGAGEPSRAKIGVCCGDDGCGDIPGTIGTGGVEYFAGDYVNVSGNFYYCLNNGSWGFDLDHNNTQTACTDAGFLATGEYCCSEWDDTSTWINESYNDPNSTAGACFKGTPQINNNFLLYGSVEYNDVFVFNGYFNGCGFDDSLFDPTNAEHEQGPSLCNLSQSTDGRFIQECLQSIEDWPNPGTGGNDTKTNEPLIKETDYCTLLNTTQGQFYCSYNNSWVNSHNEDLSHQSIVPETLFKYINDTYAVAGINTSNLTDRHCCLPSECWDPNSSICITEQVSAEDVYKINSTTAYKCLQGEWINVFAEGQRSPDGCDVAFCPEPGQCLYNINGDPSDNGNVSANPQCIYDGQFIGDYVCDNGNWASRTKLLALEMSSLISSGDDFVLMCVPPDEALVNLQSFGATNNVCVLNHEGKRVIGTTLNQPLYKETINPDGTVTYEGFIIALDQSFLLSYPTSGISFNSTACDGITSFDSPGNPCVDIDDSQSDISLKLYYDDTYKMVVFSDEYLALSPGFWETICNLLPSWLSWVCPGPSELETDLQGLQLFNRIYAAKSSNSRNVFGIAEELCDNPLSAKKWRYSFNYTGYSGLNYLVRGFSADNATVSPAGKHIFIKNPDPNINVWTALTLLRNTEQE